MSQSWQWPSGLMSSRPRACCDAVRQLGQMMPQRSSTSPAGTALSNARSTSRRSWPHSSASANGRTRTTSASAPSRTSAPSLSASDASTPSSFMRCTQTPTARASDGDTGFTYGLAAPSRTCASMSAPSDANFAVKSFAFIQATGASSGDRGVISMRTVARVPPSSAPALSAPRPLERAPPRVRVHGAAPHPPVHAERPLMAPLERKLLVDELEPARPRLDHEAGARRRAVLDRPVVHVVHSKETVESLGVGKQRPHPLGRRGEIHRARDDNRAHRSEGITRVRCPGVHWQPTAYGPSRRPRGARGRGLSAQGSSPSARASGGEGASPGAGGLSRRSPRAMAGRQAALDRPGGRGARHSGRRPRGGRPLGAALVRAKQLHSRGRRARDYAHSRRRRHRPSGLPSPRREGNRPRDARRPSAGARDRGHHSRLSAGHDDGP